MFAHRSVRIVLFVTTTALAGVALADDGNGQQVDCSPGPQVQRWLNSQALAIRIQSRYSLNLAQGSLVIIAYDHLMGSWNAFRPVTSGSSPPTLQPMPLTLEPTDDPRVPLVRLGHGDKLLLVVTNVNPLLYNITDEKITSADIPELASIQNLAAAFGGVLSTYLGHLSGKAAPTGPSPTAARILERYHTRSLAETLPPVPEVLERLARAIDRVNEVVTATIDGSADAADFLQATEVGNSAAKIPDASGWPGLLDRTQTNFRQLRVLLPEVAHLPEACAALADIAAAALSIRDKEPPPAEEAQKLSSLRQGLAVNRTCPGEGRERIDAMLAKADYPGLSAFVNLATSVHAIADLATSIQSKSNTVVTASVWLGDLARRMTDHVATSCDAVAGVIESPDVLLTARWDKIYTKTFSIKRTADGVAAGILSTRPGSVEATFQVASSSGNVLGIGAGVIYTPLVNPRFGAVEDPSNPSQKVIARTAEESRAGDVVLILAYRPFLRDSWFRPGIQIGAATASHATLLLGGSFDFSRFVRLGVGVTWQEVDRLSAEQNALSYRKDGTVDPGSVTVVSSSDDIRTHKGVDHAWYASLTLSIDSLKFFPAK